MTRPLASSRVLLAALLLGGALPARADIVKPEDQIKDACAADAVAVNLADPPAGREGGAPSNADRPHEAQKTANRLGAGVESETNAGGQTLSWKRKGTPAQCRTKLQGLRRDFPGRVTFEPTTEDRIAQVRAKRDAMIPDGMRKDAANPLNGALFDGAGALLGGQFSPKADSPAATPPAVNAPVLGPDGKILPVSFSPPVQLPLQYHGPLSNPVPQFQNYTAPTIAQRFVAAAESTTAYVSDRLRDAGNYITGVARSVKNGFFSGIEMIQGYGYKFIHAGRATNWGTKPLVDGLRRIAAYMRAGGRGETDLAIGDISSAQGGQLGGHASHQNGRDVDIGFYMTDQNGRPVDAQGFVTFTQGKDGLSGPGGVRFDAQRNWFLVQAILANDEPGFQPKRIFIANHLKNAILVAAGDSPDKARAANLMGYWAGHDNHLHLRVE